MRGMNFGGALDGDDDGRLGARHLDVVREAGFDTVRLPVKWSAHLEPDHTVEPAFFERVDRAVYEALRRDLHVVLDVHHFDDVDRRTEDFLALWSQIGRRYADAGDRLAFELLNEPHPPFAADAWNDLLAEALAVVRASNPERPVIAGPVLWNTVDGLQELRLPDDDRLIVTVHYYSPFQFTHQGAVWLAHDGAAAWLGTAWGTEQDRARVTADLEGAAAWARERGRPLFLGEFGVIEHADMAARADWTALVRSEAERLGIGWAYWDFATDFGAFDVARHAWREPLRRALVGDDVSRARRV